MQMQGDKPTARRESCSITVNNVETHFSSITSSYSQAKRKHYLVSDATGIAESPGQKLTDDTLVQPARLQTAWFPPQRNPGCRLQGSTLNLSPSGSPSASPFPPACQQQVVGSVDALCSASLAKCTGLIALLNMHPLPSIKANYLWHIHPPPQLGKKCCLMLIAVYTERRDQCQVSFPLAIPRTPRAP